MSDTDYCPRCHSRIVQLIIERDRWRFAAEQRVALRREIEELLGFKDGATYDPAEFERAVERLRQWSRLAQGGTEK